MSLATASVLGLALAGAACGGRGSRDSAASRVDPRDHGRSEEARFAAAAMPHKQVRAALGGHRFEARHEVASTLAGQPERAYKDEYLLVCRSGGDCHGRLHNSQEYGVELVRLGHDIYFRHRYQEFLRFAEEREESERRVEHLFGIGAAVLGLLAPGVHLVPAGEATVEGRKAARYRLVRRRLARPRRPAERHRAWRARMTVEKAEGEVWLDRGTGAPLRFEVRYRVSAPKDGRPVALTGSLVAGLKELGKSPEVKPPARFTEATPRDRETLDVRALLGDHRLNPGWFRGGGPHAARERLLGVRPSATSARTDPPGMGSAGPMRQVPPLRPALAPHPAPSRPAPPRPAPPPPRPPRPEP